MRAALKLESIKVVILWFMNFLLNIDIRWANIASPPSKYNSVVEKLARVSSSGGLSGRDKLEKLQHCL